MGKRYIYTRICLLGYPPSLCCLQKRWLSLYGAKFGLGPSQAGPLQQVLRQQLAKEVTQQLFSHIDWDRV